MENEARWAKWEAVKPVSANCIWDVGPGTDFVPEVDIPTYHSLFLDETHSSPPVTPLFSQHGARYWSLGITEVNEDLGIPTCRGFIWKHKEGGLYIAFLVVRDPEEIKRREARFREAIRPYLEDFGGFWQKKKKELKDLYERLKQFNPEGARNVDLLHHLWDIETASQKVWEAHFTGMQPSYMAWVLLEEECKKRFGINDQSPEFQDMMRGFDNDIYRVDKQIWELSKQALDMGLGDVFRENEPEAIMPKLEVTAKGKEWLKKYNDFLQVHGWRVVRMMDLVNPYWLEKPSIPLETMKSYIVSGIATKKEYIMDERRREVSAKRESAIKAMLNRVPPQDSEWFRSLITLAQWASTYSEEHDLYCEFTSHAFFRRGYLGIGKRFAEEGAIDRPEDVFMLGPWEMEAHMLLPHQVDFRWLTRRRRAQWEEWVRRFNAEGEWRQRLYTDRPGGFEEAVAEDLLPSRDPIVTKIVIGEMPAVTAEELRADIVGLCGSPGQAEGVARVCKQYAELDRLQPGEILVCTATDATWTPGFNKAAAVITDKGGTLSHAAIVGREYGLPVVVNTFVGTQKIRSGQRVRVDAAQGAIYILNK